MNESVAISTRLTGHSSIKVGDHKPNNVGVMYIFHKVQSKFHWVRQEDSFSLFGRTASEAKTKWPLLFVVV